MDSLEAAIREELSSARTARFIGMLALFLYWAHMPERCGVERDAEKLGKLLCAVQNYFASLRRRMMRRRRTLLYVLPILLLSARVTIEALFRTAFKKWWTTIDGRTTLQVAAQTHTLHSPQTHTYTHRASAPRRLLDEMDSRTLTGTLRLTVPSARSDAPEA